MGRCIKFFFNAFMYAHALIRILVTCVTFRADNLFYLLLAIGESVLSSPSIISPFSVDVLIQRFLVRFSK